MHYTTTAPGSTTAEKLGPEKMRFVINNFFSKKVLTDGPGCGKIQSR